MRTYREITSMFPKAMPVRDVFAAYYHDGEEEEWIYFKLLPWHTVRYIVRAMQQMRIFPHYRLERNREDFRNGYVNEKCCCRMIDRDMEYLPLNDLKRIVSELVESCGFNLHWIPVTKMLNLKYKI